MKAAVDPDRCHGHNCCCAFAPGLFDIDELGYTTRQPDKCVAPAPCPSPSPPHRTGS